MWNTRLLHFRGGRHRSSRRRTQTDHDYQVWLRQQRKRPWLVPRVERFQLVLFQKLFSQLQGPEEKQRPVLLRDMQRCMSRIFRLTGVQRKFDARRYDQRGDGTVGWWEFCKAWKEEDLSVEYTVNERIFLTLEDPQSSRLGRLCSLLVLLAILASAGSFIISTLPEMQVQACPRCEPEAHPAFEWIDTVCVVLFTVEYLMRLVTAITVRAELTNQDELVRNACAEELMPTPSMLERVWQFVRAWPSLIDLLALFPTYVAWAFPQRQHNTASGSQLALVKLTRLMRVVRAFRLGRRFEAVVIIAKAMHRSLRILWVLVLNLGLNMVVFGAIIFLFEQGEYLPETGKHWRKGDWSLVTSPEGTMVYERDLEWSPFESIPHSFWWSLVTVTTVGYGDMVPTTTLGKVTAGVAAVWSLCVLALPVGVIGANFQRVWEDYDKERHREIEVMRNAQHMEKQANGALDPLSHSRRLLFEVYHDSALHTRANDIFIGEAEIELQLEPESAEPVCRRLRLQLQENREKSRRKVSGELQVQYAWHPTPTSGDAMELEGTLSVTIFSARNLVAVDWKGSGLSDPYVLITVYPESPPEGIGTLEPQQVQTKTIFDEPTPSWNETWNFAFSWHQSGIKAQREHELHQQDAQRSRMMAQLRSLPGQQTSASRDVPGFTRSAEIRRLLRTLPHLRQEAQYLRQTLPQLRSDVSLLRESVKEVLVLTGATSAATTVDEDRGSGGGSGGGRAAHVPAPATAPSPATPTPPPALPTLLPSLQEAPPLLEPDSPLGFLGCPAPTAPLELPRQARSPTSGAAAAMALRAEVGEDNQGDRPRTLVTVPPILDMPGSVPEEALPLPR